VADYDEAIRLGPNDGKAYMNLGIVYAKKANYDKAFADFREAIQLMPGDPYAYNQVAWTLATCPQADCRDGKKAVEDATRACTLSEWKDPEIVDTLAAACAEAGDFDAAMKWENQYLKSSGPAGTDLAGAQSRLALYQAHKPYRGG
jgi:Flp pilus assembly protein TadD